MSGDKPRYELHFHTSVQSVDDKIVKTIVQDLRSTIKPLNQIPPCSQFTGRQAELEAVTTHLRQAQEKSAVLTGVAGVGKSAIAIQSAHLLKPDFPDAQLYVNLRGTESQPKEPFLVLASFIRALAGNRLAIPETLAERSNLYRSLLSNKRAIIILDNAHNEAQITPLLPHNTSGVIITTRQKLATEVITSFDIEAMSSSDALKLLQHWVGSDRLLSEPEAAKTIINLCRQLPLAICIIAAIFSDKPNWQLADCAQKLAQEQQRLLSLHLSDLVVRASISLSYQELESNTAQLFRELALLTGSTFSGTIATALLEFNPASALEQLIKRQLIENVSPTRYHFHDLVRLFAKGQLAQEEATLSRQAARLKISRWYLETSQIMDLALNPDNHHKLSPALLPEDITQNLAITAFNWFELEETNLLAALKWAYQLKASDLVVSLATNLVNFFNTYGCWEHWQQIQEMAWIASQALEESSDQALAQEMRGKKAQILANLGNVYALKSDWQKANESYQLSLSIFEELGNRLEVAKVLGNLANIEAQQGKIEQALIGYQQSLKIFSELQDSESEGQTLANFGICYAQQNQLEKAAALWQQALVKLPPELPKTQRINQWLNSLKPVVEPQPEAQLIIENASELAPTQQPANVIIFLGMVVIMAIACFLIFFI